MERTGVSPDIYVEKNFQHRLRNEDPQLERAVEEVMRTLSDGHE